MCAARNIRVLTAKISLDGHDRGIKVVSRMLRDAGMDVVYLGTHLTPETVIRAAIQEDVDVIGLSFLSGEHLACVGKFAELMKEHGLDDVLFVVGGVIPRQDVPLLKELGVDEVFPAGSLMEEIEDYIKTALSHKKTKEIE
ncbi:MAG: cobalamin B12-binding domain-containing protein [bacterium]